LTIKYLNHILCNFKLDTGNRNLLYYIKYYYQSENLLSEKTGGGGRTMLEARCKSTFRTVLLFLIPALLCSLAYSKIIYVDDDAAGANDGTSWENAYTFLQDALADANSAEKPTEIRVAQGFYKPDQGANQTQGDRKATFQLINGTILKGGYAGFGHTDPNTRDIELYKTILNGDLADNDVPIDDPNFLLDDPSRTDNCIRVVTATNASPNTILEGIVITGAYFYYPEDHDFIGAGLYVSGNANITVSKCMFISNAARGIYCSVSDPCVVDCVFKSSLKGGMYIDSGSPRIVRCIFEDNWDRDGGGLFCNRGRLYLENCTFARNVASGLRVADVGSGGGLCCDYSYEPGSKIINCIFIDNVASSGGAAHFGQTGMVPLIARKDERILLTGCAFIRNRASSGGALHQRLSTLDVQNSVFRDNSSLSSGGVIWSSLSITNFDHCIFSGNSAFDSGASIYAVGSETSSVRGDPLLLEFILTLNNCTFRGNSAPIGRTLHCISHDSADLDTTIISNCIIDNDGNEIHNPDGSQITINYTDLLGGASSIDDPCNAVVWGEGNIDVDPEFVQAGYWTEPSPRNPISSVWIEGDYHLKSEAGRWDTLSESWVADNLTSPCIDAGDPNSPVAFEPDPNGGRINMGAYGGTAEASKSPAFSWWLQTTQGPVPAQGLGIVLPHEHIFTDLRGPTMPGYGQADAADVVRVMAPLLADAREKGVGVLIECTGIGVGRNVAVIAHVAEASGLPVVVPTGVYGRANFAPPEHQNMTEDELTTLFISEIRDGIEGTGIKAGFIKIATDESPMNALLEKILRAAGRTASETGAAIASHTPVGSNAVSQVDILESIDPAIRFIWVHAQNESNRNIHVQLAARGVYIEFDSLGWNPGQDPTYIAAIKNLLAAGHGDRILLSHDAGWYQPGETNGGTQKPFTYLIDTFIPKLKDVGVDDATIRMITQTNPVRAFGFKSGE